MLKVPLSALLHEVYLGKDVDPSTPDDLMKVFTPDGSFPVDEPIYQRSSIGGVAAQMHQDMIPIKPEFFSPNFIGCATCGLEDGNVRIACMKFPRSYHDSCLPAIVNDPSSGDQDTQKMGECIRCGYDRLVRPEEDISSGNEVMSKAPEKMKIDKAYGKYKSEAQSYTFMSMILWELLQILEKLISYDYGDIFTVPGVFPMALHGYFASFSTHPTNFVSFAYCSGH